MWIYFLNIKIRVLKKGTIGGTIGQIGIVFIEKECELYCQLVRKSWLAYVYVLYFIKAVKAVTRRLPAQSTILLITGGWYQCLFVSPSYDSLIWIWTEQSCSGLAIQTVILHNTSYSLQWLSKSLLNCLCYVSKSRIFSSVVLTVLATNFHHYAYNSNSFYFTNHF